MLWGTGGSLGALGSHREFVPLTIVGLGTQRSDDIAKNNPEHLKRRICLTLASGFNVDNEMLSMRIMLKAMFTQPSPTQS
jgi:hypothetical protein